MRIGIDIYPLSKTFQGISIYLYNLLKYLHRQDKKNEYFLYTYPFSSLHLPFTPADNWRLCLQKGCCRRSATAWMQFRAAHDLKRDAIDVFFAPQGILPLCLPRCVRTLLMVNDLAYYLYPFTLKWNNRIIFPLFFKRSLRAATKISTISNAVATEIKTRFPALSDKVFGLHPAVACDDFASSDKGAARQYISHKFGTSQKYMLTVATIEPRKNIDSLLKAYSIFRKQYGQSGYQLLIAGAQGWNSSPLHTLYAQLGFGEQEVKFLGYVPQSDMVRLYAGATLFVFPSLYEGLGFPPLEALSCGTPVVASDIPVFRETMDGVAFFCDPSKPDDIARVLDHTLSEDSLREQLTQRGFERMKLFSWERTAREMLKLFEELK